MLQTTTTRQRVRGQKIRQRGERPPTRRARPLPIEENSARIMESAENIAIGPNASFTNHVTPHTTLKVNLFYQDNGERTIHPNPIPELAPEPSSQTLPPSISDLQADSNSDELRSNSQSPNPTIEPPSSSPSPPPIEPKISQEIYQQSIKLKGYGYPLYVPSTSSNSPTHYRISGICVGDVGVFTNEGGFEAAFNVYYDASHPIHSGRDLPRPFEPLPPLKPKDLRDIKVFSAGSHLMSKGIYTVATDTSGTTFETSLSEGAILTMPETTYLEEIHNRTRLQKYMNDHAEHFYRFMNDTLGREIKNGDLQVVYACRKSTAFGIATILDSRPNVNSQLRFFTRDERDGEENPTCKYQWRNFGATESKFGPEPGETDGLEAEDSRGLRNQCLFVNTIGVKLAHDNWKQAQSDGQREVVNGQSSAQPDAPSSNVDTLRPDGSSSLPSQSSTDSQPPGSVFSMNIDGLKRSHQYSGTKHPSGILHDFLLKKAPHAKRAIVCDRDWNSSLISFDQNPSGLIQSVCALNNICEREGAVYFEPKEWRITAEERNTLVQPLITGERAIETYLFGSLYDRSSFLAVVIENLSVDYEGPLPGHPERPLSLDQILYDAAASVEPHNIPNCDPEVVNIVGLRVKLDSCPHSHPDRPILMKKLADLLLNRYWHFMQEEDLHDAIWNYELVLPLIDKKHYWYLEVLLGLCSSLHRRLQLLHQPDDCDRLLTCLELQRRLDLTALLCPFQLAAIQIYPEMRSDPHVFSTVNGRDSITYQQNRRALKNISRTEVWPENVDRILVEGLREYSQSHDRSKWRNEFLVDYLSEQGIERSKEQVTNHIQGLRNIWESEPEFYLVAGGDDIYITSLDLLVSTPIQIEGQYNSNSRTPFELEDAHIHCPNSASTTAMPPSPNLLRLLGNHSSGLESFVSSSGGNSGQESIVGKGSPSMVLMNSLYRLIHQQSHFGISEAKHLDAHYETCRPPSPSNRGLPIWPIPQDPKIYHESLKANRFRGRLGTLLKRINIHEPNLSPAGLTGPVDNVFITRIVSCSEDRSVQVWDALTGAELKVLNGHTEHVLSAAFSTDGTRIVPGSEDQSMRVWDASTGAELKVLNGHTESVCPTAFSTDGTRIVSGSSDASVRVWDASTGAELKVLNGHTESVWSATFSTDGTRIVSGSVDKSVQVWDASTGAELKVPNLHTSSPNPVDSPTDNTWITLDDEPE